MTLSKIHFRGSAPMLSQRINKTERERKRRAGRGRGHDKLAKTGA